MTASSKSRASSRTSTSPRSKKAPSAKRGDKARDPGADLGDQGRARRGFDRTVREHVEGYRAASRFDDAHQGRLHFTLDAFDLGFGLDHESHQTDGRQDDSEWAERVFSRFVIWIPRS